MSRARLASERSCTGGRPQNLEQVRPAARHERGDPDSRVGASPGPLDVHYLTRSILPDPAPSRPDTSASRERSLDGTFKVLNQPPRTELPDFPPELFAKPLDKPAVVRDRQ